jgi:ribulose-5-phosphate 4-epimerase/fuculose-1-phosphate aldolase
MRAAPSSQLAMLFHNGVAYLDDEGPALDLEERRRLIPDLGDRRTMILRNHGLPTAGATVAEKRSGPRLAPPSRAAPIIGR